MRGKYIPGHIDYVTYNNVPMYGQWVDRVHSTGEFNDGGVAFVPNIAFNKDVVARAEYVAMLAAAPETAKELKEVKAELERFKQTIIEFKKLKKSADEADSLRQKVADLKRFSLTPQELAIINDKADRADKLKDALFELVQEAKNVRRYVKCDCGDICSGKCDHITLRAAIGKAEAKL